jgi:hypothetical protein
MKKQIFVNDLHEYDYELTANNLHVLYYSNTSEWNDHIKGTICMSIINDGNGLIIEFNEKNRIDYSEAEQLFILLKFINNQAKYEIGIKKLL